MRRKPVTTYLCRSVALVVASVIAQAVQFIGALVAARLYGPIEVGVYGLFMAIWGFAQIASSWRYELAIVTSDNEDDARDVALFVVMAGAVAMLIGFAILFAFDTMSSHFEISGPLKQSITALPIVVVLVSLNLAGNNLCIRERRFVRIAAQQVAIAALTVLTQVALVGSTRFGNGLVTGAVLGQLGGVTVVAFPLFSVLMQRLRQVDVVIRLRRAAYAHRGFFLYTNPYAVLSQLYFQIPILLMGSLYGLREAGLFSLAYRTASSPVSLIPAAVSQVFFPELARDRQRLDRWGPRLQGTVLSLGIVMAPGVALFIAAGPEIFSLLLGDSWREAGVMAQILIVPALVMGLATGADRLYWVLSRQRTAMLITFGGVLATALTMLAATQFGSPSGWFVAVWSGTHLAFSTIWMALAYRIAGFSVVPLLCRLSVIFSVVALLSVAMGQCQSAWEGHIGAIALVFVALAIYTPLVVWAMTQLKLLLQQRQEDVSFGG